MMMGQIVLARIDDRLVHGQVMTSWLNFLSANTIIVVDDATALDPLMNMVLKNVAPSNINLEILTFEQGVVRLKEDINGEKIILLVKIPQTMENLINAGVNIKSVNVGGMAVKPGRKTIYKWLAASEEEKECINRIINQDISVSIQIIAEDKRLDAKNYFSN
jgi:PTS system mannose-specific IIB component